MFALFLGVSPHGARAASQATATAGDFEAAITRLSALDPAAPQALNARLQYADFLVNSTSGDCHARLDAAQAQLDQVASRPEARILLPLAQARLDGGAYGIHAARAGCDAPARDGELRKALDAARAAEHGYRDGLDYASAAVMQFNVAATLRALGDNQASITALQTAIAMDKEFGFRDDAQDNIRLLTHWQGGDESDAHIAELMKAVPAPATAAFNFVWRESEANETIAATQTNLIEGKAVESSGHITLARHVRADATKWAVWTDPATADIAMGAWPTGQDAMKRLTAYMLALTLLETPKFTVAKNGDFDDVKDAKPFSDALVKEVATRLGIVAPVAGPNGNSDASPSNMLAKNFTKALQPDFLENNVGEKYSLETAAWTGAKLEQGVWYKMTAPLFLPALGLGHYLITHDIEFSFARAVACAPGDAAKDCAEIVIHATPERHDFNHVQMDLSSILHMPDFDSLRIWSGTDMRLVVRQQTLEPVLSDVRRSWYAAIDQTPKAEPIVASERVVTALAYH